MVTRLPVPPSLAGGASRSDVVGWVAQHLGDLTLEGGTGVRAGAIVGGQRAADTALAALDVTGYAARRSTVQPPEQRGASRMSPYIRYGLLPLRQVWDAVADSPARDRQRYRDELLWQEYARHLYARVGADLGAPLRQDQPRPAGWTDEPWPQRMRCMQSTLAELHGDGWLVNQSRMWLASQWAVRAGADWRAGEQEMFTHLLDGSRAANRLGWQWTVGTGSGKAYGFSRWQVEKRAPQLCRECPMSAACPIQDWPADATGPSVPGPDLRTVAADGGPAEVNGHDGQMVWLTAESLGREDPALAADPVRPAVFVFDEPLLKRLRLSGKRLVFLAETLGEIAGERDLEVRRGRVTDELVGRALAATWTPVPGWGRIARTLRPVEVHPWPWLTRPAVGSARSFSAWRRTAQPR